MPGNRAIAAGADFDYAVIHVDAVEPNSRACVGEKLVVAMELLPQFLKEIGIATHHVVHVLKGADLPGTVTAHPLRGRGYDFDVPVLLGDFVTLEAGTGLVHIAPNAGADDFELGREHGLEVADTVGDDGTFNTWVPLFAGLHVYKAHDQVAAALDEAGGLLGRGKLVHSYPHSWRSKAPLIFRATPNWFIRMDGPERIREKALGAIAAAHFVPEAGRNRLGSMVASRPDWCISRQRAWGVPITVFVDKRTGEPLRDEAVVSRIVAAFKAEGADSWYSSPPSRFLGNDYNPDDYEQVMDIVDVWFEAGSTHAFVLEARKLPWPADLYLEGSDQHRGWFQSSLLEAVGTRGVAPFKAVLTDGFVMDEQGRKMSKSLGNVTAPQEVADKYGVDILRLWVMMSDTSEDLRIGPGNPEAAGGAVSPSAQHAALAAGQSRRLRRRASALPYAEMPELEKWVLHRLSELDARVRAFGAELRLDRRVSGAAQLLRHRSLGVLLRCAQGRDLLRSAGFAAAPRGPHGAGSLASLPDHLARAGAVLHRGRSLDRTVRRTGQRASATLRGRAGGMAGRCVGGALGRYPHDTAPHHRADRGSPPRQYARLIAAGRSGAAAEARP